MTPGILTNIKPDNHAYKEEFFGPLFLLSRVADEKAALTLANDTEFGLGSTVFSEMSIAPIGAHLSGESSGGPIGITQLAGSLNW